MTPKSGHLIAGIIIPLVAILVGLTNPELRCFLRLDTQELCRGEFSDVDLILQSEELKPLPEVEVRFIFKGAPEIRRTDTNGYSTIQIPRRGDVEVILSKEGFETIRHIINLGNDPKRTRTYQLKKLTLRPTPSPSPTPSPKPSVPEPTPTAETHKSPDDYSGVVINRSCSLASEAEYFYGNYSIAWTYKGLQHEGVLKMDGGIGIMVIAFYDERIQDIGYVKQVMVLANCTQGMLLLGFEPVSPHTNEQHPSYSADNILIRRNVDGSIDAANCDDQSQCARIEISRVD